MIGDSGGSVQDVAKDMDFAAQFGVAAKSKRHDAAADDVLIKLPRAMLGVVQLAETPSS